MTMLKFFLKPRQRYHTMQPFLLSRCMHVRSADQQTNPSVHVYLAQQEATLPNSLTAMKETLRYKHLHGISWNILHRNGTGNPVHLPNPNLCPTCLLTNPNFRCCAFQLTPYMQITPYLQNLTPVWVSP